MAFEIYIEVNSSFVEMVFSRYFIAFLN